MLSALLGAICAASLAFAPVSASASVNADLTSTVHSAYYDESQVSNYGTGETKWYSYLSFPLYLASYDDGWHTRELDIETGIFYTALENGSYSIDLTDLTESYGGWIVSPTIVSFDVYIDGTFSSTITLDQTLTTNGNALEGYYYDRISYNEETYPEPSYIWFFDHQGYELGTDTVADIAGGLTSGIGTVATGIGGGLQSLMQNIFLVGTVDDETGAFTATGLSTFGVVTVVFCGLALALGLSRWIVGFASSLGSRNR